MNNTTSIRRKFISARHVICVNSQGYPGSLEVRKIYRRIRDEKSEHHGLLRIVDESGEDYLYPMNYFVPVRVPSAALHAFVTAA